MVIEGVLIAESLRTGTRLEDVALTVRAIARADGGHRRWGTRPANVGCRGVTLSVKDLLFPAVPS
jgi:hypothetical protein